MLIPNQNSDKSLLKRRKFFRDAGTLAGAASLSFPHIANSAPNKSPLKLGLIGCGGRGTGAAHQALSADKDVTLTTV
ncbi:MAG TPA: oxidoreductase, partial [Verrucomicrobiales bacterium]|nr:oxidoreductase [Verrucomicrobiales bacterium]